MRRYATLANVREVRPAPYEELSAMQQVGQNCVWCDVSLLGGIKVEVGFAGMPVRSLYACPWCAPQWRLPVWPE